MLGWEVKRVMVQTESDDENLSEYLRDHWEPFAVTSTNYGAWVYHLRRKVYED